MLPSDDNKIDESKIVEVLKFSTEFNSFYKNEWKIRHIPSLWYLAQDLAEEGKAHDFRERGVRTLYIEVNHLPAIENIGTDSYLFAHEMGHIIRFYENKVLEIVELDDPSQEGFTPSVKKAISDMLEDTAVDRLLNKYCINLLPHYEEKITTSQNNLKKVKADPKGLDRTWLLLQLIKERLRWSIIQNRESSDTWMKYESCLNSNSIYYPLILERDEIISQIQGMSLDMPDDQRIVFNIIIDMCGLSDILCTKFDMPKRMNALLRKSLSQIYKLGN